MLSEGHTIFNGPPRLVKDYFEGLGLQMSRFSNPADKLSRIAAEPCTMLGEKYTIQELVSVCEQQLSQYAYLDDSNLAEM